MKNQSFFHSIRMSPNKNFSSFQHIDTNFTKAFPKKYTSYEFIDTSFKKTPVKLRPPTNFIPNEKIIYSVRQNETSLEYFENSDNKRFSPCKTKRSSPLKNGSCSQFFNLSFIKNVKQKIDPILAGGNFQTIHYTRSDKKFMNSLENRYEKRHSPCYKNNVQTNKSIHNLNLNSKTSRKLFNPNERIFNRVSSSKSFSFNQCEHKLIPEIQQLRETEDTYTITKKNNHQTNNTAPKISDFTLIKLLGKGKNGQVYLAIHKFTNFACALKIVSKSKIRTLNQQKRKKFENQLLEEIKIQFHLKHSNLIQLYGVFDDRQNIYMIQELGVSGQLYEVMKKKGKFSQETTAFIANSLIEGLKAMHQKQVIHRDLKPENIVLSFGVCKICDFGWSTYAMKDLRSTFCGTPLYISPEMFVGEDYDKKIDIWAYGILVYELFTGQNPFRITKKSELNRIITHELAIGENMPTKLKYFLHFILKKKISLRPIAAEISEHKWLEKYRGLEICEELSRI